MQLVASVSVSGTQTASMSRCNGTSNKVGRLLPRSIPISCCRIMSTPFPTEPFRGKLAFFLGGWISRSSALILNGTDLYRWQENHSDLWHHATFHIEILPNVKSRSFVGWFEGLWCCWLSVRNGKMPICPVFVLHHWCQIVVHIIHSQHGHLQKIKNWIKMISLQHLFEAWGILERTTWMFLSISWFVSKSSSSSPNGLMISSATYKLKYIKNLVVNVYQITLTAYLASYLIQFPKI